MSSRNPITRCVRASLLAAAGAAVVYQAAAAGRRDAEIHPVLAEVIAYALFCTGGLWLSPALSPNRKAALIGVGLAVAALLPPAVTGRLGAGSLPLILVGPSLPFVLAAWLSRPHGHDNPGPTPGPDPSPTLTALLHGKRLRAASRG